MPKTSSKATLNPFLLQWKDGNLPISPLFDDSYYSAPSEGNDGLREAQSVFVLGNNLVKRWQMASDFCTAELGFGTGLNFLETMQQWLQTAPSGSTLSFTSFELYPLEAAQIQQALTPWPEHQHLATQLFTPDNLNVLYQAGWSGLTLKFPNHKTLYLTLAVGDANKLIAQWPNKRDVDAWYLDGFSPAKNPQLWNEDLMKQVFRVTKQGGTFSTYTSAGHVRRALSDAGFEVQKVDGFGKKRHRLEGIKP